MITAWKAFVKPNKMPSYSQMLFKPVKCEKNKNNKKVIVCMFLCSPGSEPSVLKIFIFFNGCHMLELKERKKKTGPIQIVISNESRGHGCETFRHNFHSCNGIYLPEKYFEIHAALKITSFLSMMMAFFFLQNKI